MDIYGSLDSNSTPDSINLNQRLESDNANSMDTPSATVIIADNSHNISLTIHPSFNTALEILKNSEIDSAHWEEVLKLYNSRPKISSNLLVTPQIGVANTVTPAHTSANSNNPTNAISIDAKLQETIDECTRNLFKYYASLVYKYQYKLAQQKKFENYIINDTDSPSFLKMLDAENLILPPLPKSISIQQQTELLSFGQELLKNTKDSILKKFTSMYQNDTTQHLNLINSLGVYETFIESSIITDMISKSPTLKDHLYNIFQKFIIQNRSLMQLGRDKYEASVTLKNKTNNSRPSTDYNSDTDISIESTMTDKSKKPRKSIRFNNNVDIVPRYNVPNNNIDNQNSVKNNNILPIPHILCRNGDNCRWGTKCAFLHKSAVTTNTNNNNNNDTNPLSSLGNIPSKPKNPKRKRNNGIRSSFHEVLDFARNSSGINPLNNLISGPPSISFAGHQNQGILRK